MTDPVKALDGHTYERSAILRWFQTNQSNDKIKTLSPITNEKIGHMLYTNHDMRSQLEAAGHPIKSLN